MSWSIEVTGSKEGVKAEVAGRMDAIAARYQGKSEGDDILAIKARLVALIDDCAFGKDAYGVDWNSVKVSASGSHSWTEGGITSASASLSVVRTSLAL